MKVTISAYRAALVDGNGNILGMAGPPISSQKLTAAGDAEELPDECRFIRVASDTAIHLKVDGTGAADTDPMVFASVPEYFGAHEGATPSIIAA